MRGITVYNDKIGRILIHSLFDSLTWTYNNVIYYRPIEGFRKLNKPNGSDRYDARLNAVKRNETRFFSQCCLIFGVHYLVIFCIEAQQSTSNVWMTTAVDRGISPILFSFSLQYPDSTVHRVDI